MLLPGLHWQNAVKPGAAEGEGCYPRTQIRTYVFLTTWRYRFLTDLSSEFSPPFQSVLPWMPRELH